MNAKDQQKEDGLVSTMHSRRRVEVDQCHWMKCSRDCRRDCTDCNGPQKEKVQGNRVRSNEGLRNGEREREEEKNSGDGRKGGGGRRV